MDCQHSGCHREARGEPIWIPSRADWLHLCHEHKRDWREGREELVPWGMELPDELAKLL